MGFTHVEVDVANPGDPAKHAIVEFVVDTSALLTVIPRPVLAQLGIQPQAERLFKGFGGIVRRQIAVAQFLYQGDFAGASVVFGEVGDTPVLGVTALEALGYQVDPVNERIVRVESLML